PLDAFVTWPGQSLSYTWTLTALEPMRDCHVGFVRVKVEEDEQCWGFCGEEN
ncbi:hypothetical protein Tco_1573949, partial [Tanacetum coccineum]